MSTNTDMGHSRKLPSLEQKRIRVRTSTYCLRVRRIYTYDIISVIIIRDNVTSDFIQNLYEKISILTECSLR